MSETLQSAFLPSVTLTGTETLPVLSGPPNGVERKTTTAAIAALVGDVLVKTATGSLPGERVVTDTTSITVDWATDGQAKFQRAALTGDVTASANANATTIAAGAVTRAKLAAGNSGRSNVTALTSPTYTLVDADVVLDGSALAGASAVALPPAADNLGRTLWVKGSASEGIDLTPTAGTVNGAASVGLGAGTSVAMFVAAGTDWVLVFAIGFP